MADEHLQDTNERDEAKLSKGEKRKRAKRERKLNKEKKIKISARKKPGFDEEIYKETSYFIKNGLRYVHPYFFTFTTHCKGRWVGRTLIDVFSTEFRSETQEYYMDAIRRGTITVNGDRISADFILKDNDVICNRVHRHEPPVTDEPLKVVELNNEMVVLNKPSSIPVHPCGRYRHNTVVFLLGKEHGLKNLYTIHRIDRMTSGILMFARTLKKAQEIEAQVRNNELEKEYVCRVTGQFPREPIDCQQPIVVVSHKVGVCRVAHDGKYCRTQFTRLSYNGQSSVVKCIPHTGRMHQIRVHLQWLGYPIIDDPIYNHESWGPLRGKGGVSEELVLKVITELATSPTIIGAIEERFVAENAPEKTRDLTKTTFVTDNQNGSQTCASELPEDNALCTVQLHDSYKKDHVSPAESVNISVDGPSNTSDIAHKFYDRNCTECHIRRRDPTPCELTMCLHALSYKGPGWEFRAPAPEWASEDWTESTDVS